MGRTKQHEGLLYRRSPSEGEKRQTCPLWEPVVGVPADGVLHYLSSQIAQKKYAAQARAYVVLILVRDEQSKHEGPLIGRNTSGREKRKTRPLWGPMIGATADGVLHFLPSLVAQNAVRHTSKNLVWY